MNALDPIAQGQRYRTQVDLPVNFLTHWEAPFTGGGHAILPRGTIFTIHLDPPDGATAASCDPENYDELEKAIVPAADRNAPKYSGFSLSVDLAALRDSCERLP